MGADGWDPFPWVFLVLLLLVASGFAALIVWAISR
jgi:hypothetical protein